MAAVTKPSITIRGSLYRRSIINNIGTKLRDLGFDSSDETYLKVLGCTKDQAFEHIECIRIKKGFVQQEYSIYWYLTYDDVDMHYSKIVPAVIAKTERSKNVDPVLFRAVDRVVERLEQGRLICRAIDANIEARTLENIILGAMGGVRVTDFIGTTESVMEARGYRPIKDNVQRSYAHCRVSLVNEFSDSQQLNANDFGNYDDDDCRVGQTDGFKPSELSRRKLKTAPGRKRHD